MVEPIDNEGSTLIKQLENPRHDGLSAERLSDTAKRASATRAMKRLAKEIRAVIRKYTVVEPKAEEAIDELAEFFADVADSEKKQEPGGDTTPEVMTYRPIVRRTDESKRQAANQPGSDGGAHGKASKRGGRSGGYGQRGGRSGEDGRHSSSRPIRVDDVRNRLTDVGNGAARDIYFTPCEGGRALLRIVATGMNSTEELSVVQSMPGTSSPRGVLLNLTAGKRMAVSLAFRDEYRGPIEVFAESAEAGENN